LRDEVISNVKYPPDELTVPDRKLDENVRILNKTGIIDTGFTHRMLLTETVDEKMYNRVVEKDIFIKRIERELKRIAIDC